MKRKIYLTLTENELAKLKTLLENSPSHDLETIINLPPDKEDKDAYIQYSVYEALSVISGFKSTDFIDNNDLKSDLGLSLNHKRALKPSFQKIVSELGSSKIIMVKECENLAKVGDCSKLVKSKV